MQNLWKKLMKTERSNKKMNAIKKIKEHMKAIPFFMGCYNVYFNLRFGSRIKKKKKYFLRESNELLQKFTQTLNKHDILFWLEFGTLLGYYREHDFIKHDYDIDVGAFLSDSEKIRKVLTENGFKLVREFRAEDGGLEECYRYLHTTIDVFYFRTDHNNMYCYSFKQPVFPIKKKHLNKKLKMTILKTTLQNNGFEKAVFRNCDVYVPKKAEEQLVALYGKSFMVPDPSFDPKNDHYDCRTYYTYEENPASGVFMELPL